MALCAASWTVNNCIQENNTKDDLLDQQETEKENVPEAADEPSPTLRSKKPHSPAPAPAPPLLFTEPEQFVERQIAP